nr:MAG TPA: hypothetical protein [Caudoviricetes sp.]
MFFDICFLFFRNLYTMISEILSVFDVYDYIFFGYIFFAFLLHFLIVSFFRK